VTEKTLLCTVDWQGLTTPRPAGIIFQRYASQNAATFQGGMQNHMEDQNLIAIGQRLSEARASRQISLEQAEEETRIRLKYLMAMESGEFDTLPNIAVARGFLRSYARYLGLDPSQLLEEFERVYPHPVSQPLRHPASERGPHVLEMDLGRRSGGRFWMGVTVVGLLALGIIALLWLQQAGWVSLPFSGPPLQPRVIPLPSPTARQTNISPSPTNTRQSRLTTPTPTLPLAVVTFPSPTSTATPTSSPSPTVTPIPTPRETATPTTVVTVTVSPQTVTVDANIVDRAWLRVKVDDQTVLEGLVDVGKHFSWTGNRVEIRTGNAGGVQLVVNGRDLGILGKKGDVQDWVFFVQNGRVQQVTPTPTPPSVTMTPTRGTP